MATGASVETRDDWPAALAWVRRGGWRSIELTAIEEPRLRELLSLAPFALDGFERVSVHAPVIYTAADDEIVAMLAALPEIVDAIVVHPGTLTGLDALGPRLVLENMDAGKSDGRTADQLAPVFETLPEAGFCLDVAHVRTVDPSMRLGHELLDAFGPRLRQLHVSGIEPDGAHRTMRQDDIDAYAPLLERCRHVPWVLESVVAPEAALP